MSNPRYKNFIALLMGATGALLLFALMQILIAPKHSDIRANIESPRFDFIRLDRLEETRRKNRVPPAPPEIAAEPVPPQINRRPAPPPAQAPTNTNNFPALSLEGFFGAALVDGDALALVRVLPDYPPRALQRGIEGWVVLEFALDRLGAPLSPRVIESEPRGVFDSAALRAVRRWKYRPPSNNQSEAVLIRQRIRFAITE